MKRLVISFVDQDTIDIGGVKEYEVDSGVLWVLFEDGSCRIRGKPILGTKDHGGPF